MDEQEKRLVGEHWLPMNPTKATFINPHASRLSAALTKYPYQAFVNWSHAVMSFDQLPWSFATRTSGDDHTLMRQANNEYEKHGPLGLLADTNKWILLVRTTILAVNGELYSVTMRRDQILTTLREAIYRQEKAVVPNHVEYYDARTFHRQRHLQEKYHWCI